MIRQPLWNQNEWPLITLHGGADNDAFAAIFVLRVYAASFEDFCCGLFPDLLGAGHERPVSRSGGRIPKAELVKL